jgi:hypothetical protein
MEKQCVAEALTAATAQLTRVREAAAVRMRQVEAGRAVLVGDREAEGDVEVISLPLPGPDPVLRARTMYGEKLQDWMNDKLRQYDGDTTFRAKRDVTHTDRRGYARSLQRKVVAQMDKVSEFEAQGGGH